MDGSLAPAGAVMSPVTATPYSRARSKGRTVLFVIGWLACVALAPYILVFPPVSYEGFGLVASVGWGVMAGAGAVLILIGNLRKAYLVEAPGVMLVTAGVAIYALLSWEQTIHTSPGSGPRALLLVTFISAFLLDRALELWAYHKTLERIDRIGRG